MKHKILLVDDDNTNIELLKAILADQDDYELEAANDGQEALAVAATFSPDIILLDVNMPVMDGYACCQHLKQDDTMFRAKIIMLTANVTREDILKGYRAGADDYVKKPFEMMELLAKIRVYLRLKTHEELNRLKNETMAMVCHELNTPLNGILPVIMLLKLDDLTESQKQLVDMLEDSSQRLHALVKKSIDMAKDRTGIDHWATQENKIQR